MANLLIIEDDPKICLFLSDFADSWGHRAAAANTVGSGMELAASGDFDLVLLDLELPDGNGLQALPELLRCPSRPWPTTCSSRSGSTLRPEHRT
jgi:DNA-binding response OmpR family regulator